ncbi:DNA-binding transcriptional regulator, AcrR family [Acetitomaculum ruminis DSM 5522]|uniref:DNA-binding transcriptional regulator, AcrR family n=1 Tax=Acetitomaculum ruminis DSM 5522 TaxID=1120918 RepID=A0A1I1AJR4_9FIRM|nr:TetR/AcrR family transcriptional regulator [Acetitomaculum ruminis]SFB36748.1 DNA-binding transcriptional regulator, AcrR family [Acetitomaculum ruminis DSM 5522]
MKTNKEEIMLTALKMFAKCGFEAVSTSMIAGELGITKGALYRHYKSKQEIFDSIIKKMFELDEKQANETNVPAKEYEEDAESYEKTSLEDLCEFVNIQFEYWTENEFALYFRRMITLEQYKNEEMKKLYRDMLVDGPVKYSEDLFREMLNNGQLNNKAKKTSARSLAIGLYAPLFLALKLYDTKESDSEKIKSDLRTITRDFYERWKK